MTKMGRDRERKVLVVAMQCARSVTIRAMLAILVAYALVTMWMGRFFGVNMFSFSYEGLLKEPEAPLHEGSAVIFYALPRGGVPQHVVEDLLLTTSQMTALDRLVLVQQEARNVQSPLHALFRTLTVCQSNEEASSLGGLLAALGATADATRFDYIVLRDGSEPTVDQGSSLKRTVRGSMPVGWLLSSLQPLAHAGRQLISSSSGHCTRGLDVVPTLRNAAFKSSLLKDGSAKQKLSQMSADECRPGDVVAFERTLSISAGRRALVGGTPVREVDCAVGLSSSSAAVGNARMHSSTTSERTLLHAAGAFSRARTGDLALEFVASTLRSTARVLLVSHDFELQGAQMFLYRLALAMRNAGWAHITTVSPSDGPLQALYEAEGLATLVAENGDVLNFVKDQVGSYDLVQYNTAVMCSFGLLPESALPPALIFSIHESLIDWFAGTMRSCAPSNDINRLFGRTQWTTFVARSTETAYLERFSIAQHSVIHLGIDLDKYDAYVETTSRAAARQELGLPPRAFVVICVGTVEPRKGQMLVAKAFDAWLEATGVDAYLLFVGKKGSGQKEYTDKVEVCLTLQPRPTTSALQPLRRLQCALNCPFTRPLF